MKKPRYMEELLKIIFLWLGIAFIFMGFLTLVGVLQPTASSMIQDSTVLGIFFASIGIAFIMVQTVLQMIVTRKNRLCSQLLANGIKLNGIVEKIYLQTSARFEKKSPYRVLYSYTYKGKTYQHKSCLLWNNPDFVQGDSIRVYANEFGKSTIEI